MHDNERDAILQEREKQWGDAVTSGKRIMKVYLSKLLDTQPSVDPDQLPLFDVQPNGTFVLPEAS